MLRLLGEPHLELAGGRTADLPVKFYVLVSLLTLRLGSVGSREQLRELLWEGAPPENSSRNLRWVLVKWRRVADRSGICLMDVRPRTIGRSPGSIDTDVDVLVSTTSIESKGDLERVLDAYRGELLRGLDAQLEPGLASVVADMREQMRRRFLTLCRAAADRIGGDTGEELLLRLTREFPEDESLVQALFSRVHAERGEKAALGLLESTDAPLGRDSPLRSLGTRAVVAQLLPNTITSQQVRFGSELPRSPTRSPGIPKVALLPPTAPFDAPSRTLVLAHALIEDINLHLTRMRSFAIFAPHTAKQVVGLDPVAAVEPFGAGYVATTRLLPTVGGGQRLSLAFMNTASRQILFADQFEFAEADPGAAFAELAQTIAGQLASVIEDVELAGYRATGEASAYAHSLLGAQRLKARDLPSLRRARRHFLRALELTPRYVPAMAGLARTYSWEALALRRPERDLAERALALADDALAVDPLDPAPWREKALASLYLHDIQGSLEHLSHARKRARHHADILAEMADVLVHASKPREAKATIEEAIALNPLSPDMYVWTLGSAEFFLGHYERSVETLLAMRNTDDVSRLIAAAAAMAGDKALAARYRRRWMEIYPDSRLENFASFMPHANRADVGHYLDALKRAGFR